MGVSVLFKSRLRKLLIRGVTQGKNPKALAGELRRYMTEKGKLNATYNSQRLMITEMTRVQTEVQRLSYKNAGIDEYEFIAEPSACDVCKPLDGKIFKLKDMQGGINAPSMHLLIVDVQLRLMLMIKVSGMIYLIGKSSKNN